MALIECGECGKQVSDKAANCPGCGAPIGQDIEAKGSGVKNLATTQLTSKNLKAQTAISVVLISLSVVWAVASEGRSAPPVLLFFLGFVWFIVTRIRIWWHHS